MLINICTFVEWMAEVHPQKRRRTEGKGRSRNGCQTCVRKRVKCDEQHPECGRCIRLRLECEWAVAKPPLASRRRGLGPIKDRQSWNPPAILSKSIHDDYDEENGESSMCQQDLSDTTTLELDDTPTPDQMLMPELDELGQEIVDMSPTPIIPDYDMLISSDINLTRWMSSNDNTINPNQLHEHSHVDLLPSNTQLILPFTPLFSFLSAITSISFTHPIDPAPSVGSNDTQAVAFHRSVLAPMKSTRIAALSSHTLFLDFAVQSKMALHFLLAFSHSELAIHQGYSDRPPLESYLHFQHGSQLLTQALESSTPTNHIAMMLSFLYLYMFWMRRDPLHVSRVRELSASVLAYIRAFTLDDLCASATVPSTDSSALYEPTMLSRILTYIYDRDVFCGFFGCGEVFSGYVSDNDEKRQQIWRLSRMPFFPVGNQAVVWPESLQFSDDHHRMILDVYFGLITIQHEINRYSQHWESGLESRESSKEYEKYDMIHFNSLSTNISVQDQPFLFDLAGDGTQQATSPPLMALVAVTFFHALEIYLHRSRETGFGEMPVPSEVQRALKDPPSSATLLSSNHAYANIAYSTMEDKVQSATEAKQEVARPSCEMGDTIDTLSPEEEKKLVRKIDLRLMPLLIISYGLQYLDKTSLAYSAILGLREDLNLVGQQFSWTSSIFYIGYLCASYPISLGFVKFPLGKYLSILMFIWGIVLTLHAVASNYPSLMVLRTLLGAFESAISPGFSLITGMWYTPHEHVSRHSFWFAGNASASIVDTIIAYGILGYKGDFAQWKMLFLIFGLITIAWSVFLYFYLPDSPATARFLTPSEREFAALRPKKFQRTTQTKKWDRGQFIETMKDVKAWWFFLFSFIICVPNGGTTSFSTVVIKSFGYDEYQTILMGLPASAFQLTTVILVAVFTTYVPKSRHIALVLTYLMAIGGILMIKLLPDAEKLSRLAGFWLIMAVAPAFPLMLSLSASNIAGFTKKLTVMAIWV
ncbi:hypothetical protein FALBO_2729 [Fusarium albosuccineum]|uniref:Zn(2)-C6 fungal-type domain-containing protein n=1 Tax=Fusarium albosuccineum TaxID=1237068 RepID=A0A8H4PF90_9HYPO|nr:hypothetical protein FALBO_2729 [Fusarium albosuccineum]